MAIACASCGKSLSKEDPICVRCNADLESRQTPPGLQAFWARAQETRSNRKAAPGKETQPPQKFENIPDILKSLSPGEATILACAFFLALGVLAPWGTGFGISVSGLQAGLIGFLILLAAFVIAYSVYHKKLHPESNGALWAQVVALSLALLLLILQYYAIHSTTLFGVQVVSVGWGLNLDLLSAIVGTVTSIRMISSNS